MNNGYGDGQALGVRWAPAPAAKTGYGPDPACQPCPDCGGLECLCRPRFFAGQLLTEQDLNRLDHYIVEKHKLHNRHLFGWGVVCGLEVLCDQCEDRVRVTPGYALSPCGEDIVVCKPDVVDICALIERCRKSDMPDCRPYGGDDGCAEVEEDWVLAIRYTERPGRGATPLVGPASCGCGTTGTSACGCGGRGPGGCSCGGTAASPAPKSDEAPRLRRGAPPSCEPTVTCEGYRYEVFRKPEQDPQRPGRDQPSDSFTGSFAGLFESLDGDLARRIACCLRDLEHALPKPPGDFNAMTAEDRQPWYRWACAVKRSLASYYTRIGGTDCEIVARLGAIPVPAPSLPLDTFKAEFGQALLALLLVTFDAILHCICSNLLPPCPGLDDPRVPLAVVTVRRNGCNIVKVCNWTPMRRHVLTFRTLSYWLGWLPLRDLLRNAIEAFCCNTLGLSDQLGVREVRGVDDADAMKRPLAFDLGFGPAGLNSVLTSAAALGLAGDRGATAGDIFDLAFRRPVFATGGFADKADEARMAASLADSGLARVLAGLVQSTGLGGSARGLFSAAGTGADLAALRERLDAQEKEIAALRAVVGR
jgi:hypothetical protein